MIENRNLKSSKKRRTLLVLGFVLTGVVNCVQAQQTMEISWLTSEIAVMAWGVNNVSSSMAVIEFYQEDLINYKSTKKNVIAIKEIQFYLANLGDGNDTITNCKVFIMQGQDIATATVKHTQEVTNWVWDWNVINLDSVYTIVFGQRLYIGYELSFSGDDHKIYHAVASECEPQKGWLGGTNLSTGIISFDNNGYCFLIKATAIVVPAPQLCMISVDDNNHNDIVWKQEENVVYYNRV